MLDEIVAYHKGNPIRMATTKIATKKPDAEWDQNMKKMFWYHNTPITAFEQKELFDLRERLLQFGGYETCLPRVDTDVEDILNRGQLWFGDRIKMRKGAPCGCHRNSALLWSKNPANYVLCTGYALSKDGLWRQHSWLVEPRKRKSRIIETTVERVAYFGFAMTRIEALHFCANNY